MIELSPDQAVELGEYAITANCISPGPILTDLPHSTLTPDQQSAFSERTALGHLGETEAIAGPTLLLASKASRYITGTSPVVDGGYTG